MSISRVNPLVPIATLILSLSAILPARAQASTWRVVAVAQPLLCEGYMEIRDVPYSTDSFVPGAEVRLTCEPNSIRNVGEDPDEQVRNLNAASRCALSVEVGPVWNGRDVLDTLAVTLDATRVDSAARGFRARPDPIVEATLLCVRINAARSGFPTKYLNLRVLGPARLQRLGRVYAVEHLGLPTRTFDFGAPVDQETPPRRR